MSKITKNIRVLYYHFGVIATVTFVLSFVCTASAEQPTATIRSLSGVVQVSLQGREAVAAEVGTILQTGDIIQTLNGAEVVLELSDGSELQLGESTSIDIAELVQESTTGARTSRVKLLWGRIRAILSPGHQQEGSSFSIETPNTLVGVKFSQPIVEVNYDPVTDTTTIDAQTVDVVVTILATQRIELLQQGQRGIVQKHSFSLGTQPHPSRPSEQPQEKIPSEIQEKVPPLQEGTPSLPDGSPAASPPRQFIRTNAFGRMRNSVRGAAGATVPLSVGSVAPREPGTLPQIPGTGGGMVIDTIPSPGVRLDRADQQHRIIMIHIYRE